MTAHEKHTRPATSNTQHQQPNCERSTKKGCRDAVRGCRVERVGSGLSRRAAPPAASRHTRDGPSLSLTEMRSTRTRPRPGCTHGCLERPVRPRASALLVRT
eukprot:799142-Prymnesium_polylepis.1